MSSKRSQENENITKETLTKEADKKPATSKSTKKSANKTEPKNNSKSSKSKKATENKNDDNIKEEKIETKKPQNKEQKKKTQGKSKNTAKNPLKQESAKKTNEKSENETPNSSKLNEEKQPIEKKIVAENKKPEEKAENKTEKNTAKNQANKTANKKKSPVSEKLAGEDSKKAEQKKEEILNNENIKQNIIYEPMPEEAFEESDKTKADSLLINEKKEQSKAEDSVSLSEQEADTSATIEPQKQDSENTATEKEITEANSDNKEEQESTPKSDEQDLPSKIETSETESQKSEEEPTIQEEQKEEQKEIHTNNPIVTDEKDYSIYTQFLTEKEDDIKKEDSSDVKPKSSSTLEKILPLDTDEPKELLRKVITIMCSVIIFVCLIVLVVSTFGDLNGKGSPDGTKDPMSGFVEAGDQDEVKFPQGIQDKYKELYLVNNDLVGLISIDATSIEQPVVQSKDNNYYLSHDYYKKSSKEGTVFMDSKCSKDLSSFNTVLYANNNKEESFIFSPLLKYSTVDGYKQAPVITFNTIFADYRWKIYACYITTVNADDDNGYVFDFANQNLNEANFAGYIEQVDMRKLYTTGVDITPTDKLLNIAIPIFNIYGTDESPVETRLVILARQLRAGESEEVKASLIRKLRNPYKPQAHYDHIGKQNPTANAPKWIAN